MIFDKNQYKCQALRRKLAKETDPEAQRKLRKRISRYEKKGPAYHIKLYDSAGKAFTEAVPGEYRGKRGAERYEDVRIAELEKGTFKPKSTREVWIDEVLDFYLEGKLLGKPGYSSAKTYCGHIRRLLPRSRLSDFISKPQILSHHFADFPDKDFSPKSVWNYRATLRAAVQFWIDVHELFVYNPVDRVTVPKDINVQEYVPTDEDFDAVYMASFVVGLDDEIRNMLTATFESGLRIEEVLKWKIEEMDLSAPVFDDTGRPIFLPYFTTLVKKQGSGKVIRRRIPVSHRLWVTMKAQVGSRTSGYVFSRQTPPYRFMRWVRCPECGKRIHFSSRPPQSGRRPKAGDTCESCRRGVLENWSLNQEAGVPYERPFHDYRKSVKYRNKILRRLPKELTKKFQGHATDSMDEYYLHLGVQDLYAVVEDTWKRPEKREE